jgi:hypothetical protein
MLRAFFGIVVLVLLTTAKADAQYWHGVVYDSDTKEPLPGVTITSKKARQFTVSDKNGNFYINVLMGDTVFFSHPAYTFTRKIVSPLTQTELVLMDKRKIELEEVEVLSGMKKFQRDSAERRVIYRKTIGESNFKIQQRGLGVSGLFSWVAYKVSGKQKRAKNFVSVMQQNEERQFISLRYNASLVHELTGLNNDEAMKFVAENPMPYDFARAASPLEIRAWVRERFRNWDKK